MYKPVKDATQLRKMVEKGVRGLYGKQMQNIKIHQR